MGMSKRTPSSGIFTALIAILLLCEMAAPAFALPGSNWTHYRNERFGFALEYPADVFVVDRRADAGDGVAFVSLDTGARLLIGALRNESGFTPASYQAYIAERSYPQYRIGYRRLAGNWFVLSGEGDGKIFYEKVMFSCSGRLINSFALIYPIEQRRLYDSIVERIEDSFRPGDDCRGVGLPANRPRSSTAGPDYHADAERYRAGTVSAERSELADRIARSRGNDVIVVLRRTSPPYDRKVVRGYVSRP